MSVELTPQLPAVMPPPPPRTRSVELTPPPLPRTLSVELTPKPVLPAVVPPAPGSSRTGLYVVLALIVIAGAVVAYVMLNRPNDAPKNVANANVVIAVPDAAPVIADAAVVEPDAVVAEDAALTVVVDAGVKPPVRTPPSPPKVNLPELTATAVREMAAGNLSIAIATFKKATAASSTYAPAWRGLGIAYEKQGAKAQAVSAFQRYLAISPGARDTQTIRDRIERLKK